jgi:hypothetical protein
MFGNPDVIATCVDFCIEGLFAEWFRLNVTNATRKWRF